MDRQTLLRHIEMLKRHSKIERIPVSRALEKLVLFSFQEFFLSMKSWWILVRRTYFDDWFYCLVNDRLQGFVESREKSDPLLFPVDKRHNPWAEKSKCNLIWEIDNVERVTKINIGIRAINGSLPVSRMARWCIQTVKNREESSNA